MGIILTIRLYKIPVGSSSSLLSFSGPDTHDRLHDKGAAPVALRPGLAPGRAAGPGATPASDGLFNGPRRALMFALVSGRDICYGKHANSTCRHMCRLLTSMDAARPGMHRCAAIIDSRAGRRPSRVPRGAWMPGVAPGRVRERRQAVRCDVAHGASIGRGQRPAYGVYWRFRRKDRR